MLLKKPTRKCAGEDVVGYRIGRACSVILAQVAQLLGQRGIKRGLAAVC
ncbi:MAG: hypothetical protein HZB85_06230 [Deltaproteobacteria bacterium]|nr:hypothetical protein [Deltaproteobacteria bacterium]